MSKSQPVYYHRKIECCLMLNRGEKFGQNTPHPVFLGAFMEGEANLGINSISPIPNAGISMDLQPLHHSKPTANIPTEKGWYYVADETAFGDQLFVKQVKGTNGLYINPLRRIFATITTGEKSKRVPLQIRGFICYRILSDEIPEGFTVTKDDHPHAGHCVCYPNAAVGCVTLDDLQPTTLKVGVCLELCTANWEFCCICIEARAEPVPFRDIFDGDVWNVARLLFYHDFDCRDDANVGILLHFWADNDYQ